MLLQLPSKRDLLERFLRSKGIEAGQLTRHVERVYGPVLLVAATGSILAGLGNERSDLDLVVIVDCQGLSDLPMVSFNGSVLVDVEYHAKNDIRKLVDRLEQGPWPDVRTARPKDWLDYARAIRLIGRLAIGLPLESTGSFVEQLFERLEQDWLAQRFAASLRVEAERVRTGARWLLPTNPRLACERLCDAVLIALEARNASAGRLYPERKWTLEKLGLAGDHEGLQMGREALRTPLDVSGAGDYASRMNDCLAELLHEEERSDLEAQLWFGAGVKLRRLGSRQLVSRWDRLAYLMPERVELAEGKSAPVWRGGLGEDLPRHLLPLFLEDMTCLTVARRE